MRSFAYVLAVIAGVALATPASSETPQTFQTSRGPATFEIIGHASMVWQWNGHTICVDPGNRGTDRWRVTCDLVLITHGHSRLHEDHFVLDTVRSIVSPQTVIIAPPPVYRELAELRPQTIEMNQGVYFFEGILPVQVVRAYNTDGIIDWHPQGDCNGYVLTFGDLRVYIAGDTDVTPEMLALTGIDVAFLPLRPPFTMTPAEAVAAVAIFRPAIVYPYHYGNGRGEDPYAFAAAVHATPGNTTQVRVLNWYEYLREDDDLVASIR